MNESESFFTVQREIRLRGISPKFSPPEAGALLSGLELVVCSDGWDRTVSGHEPASPCLLVFAFLFFVFWQRRVSIMPRVTATKKKNGFAL